MRKRSSKNAQGVCRLFSSVLMRLQMKQTHVHNFSFSTFCVMRVEIRGSWEDEGVVEDWSDVLWQPFSGQRAAGKWEENVASREANREPADLSIFFFHTFHFQYNCNNTTNTRPKLISYGSLCNWWRIQEKFNAVNGQVWLNFRTFVTITELCKYYWTILSHLCFIHITCCLISVAKCLASSASALSIASSVAVSQSSLGYLVIWRRYRRLG